MVKKYYTIKTPHNLSAIRERLNILSQWWIFIHSLTLLNQPLKNLSTTLIFRQKSRHLVARDHGHWNDWRYAALSGRTSSQGPLPDRQDWKAKDQGLEKAHAPFQRLPRQLSTGGYLNFFRQSVLLQFYMYSFHPFYNNLCCYLWNICKPMVMV